MQNGFIESFNGRLRDELLSETLFGSIVHARVILAEWRANWPHSRLGWMTPLAYAPLLPRQRGEPLRTGEASRLTPLHIPPKWAQLSRGFHPSLGERWGSRQFPRSSSGRDAQTETRVTQLSPGHKIASNH